MQMPPGGIPSQQQVVEQQQKAEKQEEMRKDLIQKILQPEALERLKRIGITKPDKVGRGRCGIERPVLSVL